MELNSRLEYRVTHRERRLVFGDKRCQHVESKPNETDVACREHHDVVRRNSEILDHRRSRVEIAHGLSYPQRNLCSIVERKVVV